MSSHILKFIILICIIFQTSCGIKFKKKSSSHTQNHPLTKNNSSVDNAIEKSEMLFSENDSQIISSYYLNKENSVIRKDMIMNTRILNAQKKKIIVNENIPRDIQVMPLPLNLTKMLSVLPLDILRVHIGTNVVLMNVKSRRILDIIKI